VQKCAKMANLGFYGLNYWKTVEDRCVHVAMRLTSIEFSFDPCKCNIYRDGPRGVGYPADARSVGDSHPSCSSLQHVCPVIISIISVGPTRLHVGYFVTVLEQPLINQSISQSRICLT